MVINEINRVIDLTDEIAQTDPSRELSLTKTKLEEASMWAERALKTAQRKEAMRPQKPPRR